MRTAGQCLATLLLLAATCDALTAIPPVKVPSTVAGYKLEPRAVYCDSPGASFKRLTVTGASDGSRTATLLLCCSEGSNARFEGDGAAASSASTCITLGAGTALSAFYAETQGDFVPEAEQVCETGMSSLDFDKDDTPAQLPQLISSQLCSSNGGCGLKGLTVSCQPDASSSSETSCAAGEVIQAMYIRWDGTAVHGIDGVRCRRIFAPPAESLVSQLIDADASCDGGTARSNEDVRCQGYTHDSCGCLKPGDASPVPYYGCVLSGAVEGNGLPLVTLPGVVVPAEIGTCGGLLEISVSVGEWQYVRSEADSSQCLTMSPQGMSSTAVLQPCSTAPDVLPLQQFKEVKSGAVPALEPASAPGICIMNISGDRSIVNVDATCACASLPLGLCFNSGSAQEFDGNGYVIEASAAADLPEQLVAVQSVLSKLVADVPEAIQLLGPPNQHSIDYASLDAQDLLDWSGVLISKEWSINQLLFQAVGSATLTAFPDVLGIPGLRGLRFAGESESALLNIPGMLPYLPETSTTTAIQIGYTTLTGQVPADWASNTSTVTVALIGNTALTAPLPDTFVYASSMKFVFDGNSAASPFCGSGPIFPSSLVEALPACSSLGLKEVTFYIEAVTSGSRNCADLSEDVRKALVMETYYFAEITAATCEDYPSAAGRRLQSSRFLLQDSKITLLAVVYSAPDSLATYPQMEGATEVAAARLALEEKVVNLSPSSIIPNKTSTAEEIGMAGVVPSGSPISGGSPSRSDGTGDDGDGNLIAIVGGIGAVAVIILLGLCCFCFWKSRKGKKFTPNKEDPYSQQLSDREKDSTLMHVAVDARGSKNKLPKKDVLLSPLANNMHSGSSSMPTYDANLANSGTPAARVATSPFQNGSTPPPQTAVIIPGLGPLDNSPNSQNSGSTDSNKELPRIRISGGARAAPRPVAAPLPSSSNNYPLSAECSRLSSREIHRRMRSASLRSATQNSNEVSGASSNSKASDSAIVVDPPASPRPLDPYVPVISPALAAPTPAPYTGQSGHQVPSGSIDNLSGRALPAGLAPVSGNSSLMSEMSGPISANTPKGIKLLTRSNTSRSVAPDSPDTFTQRLGESFATSVMMNTRALSARSGSSVAGGTLSRANSHTNSRMSSMDYHNQQGYPTGQMTQVFGSSQPVHTSSFASASVMSDGTTVYTDIGGVEMDDAVADMERILNRTQTELAGQVGSFRLQGSRHRFTGRTSVVAFADGMWGGQFALKFYCEPDAAEREFAIYRKATELNMVLPPVQEMEDNAGGVFRLKDGTPLPPHLAMPRGLPLPEWYAMHVPSQLAILECLAQTLHRLEQLHLSGYCHNDIKPANVILLESPNEREPRWHIVDFTAVAQSGDKIRARYTLEYASPELVRAVGAMRAHFVNCQNSMDIWSMGVIMYEVITAEPFFPLDADRDAMRDGLMGLEPLPFEEDRRSLMRVPSEGGLRDTVLSMLSREPTMRPSAATVAVALRNCIREMTGDTPERLDPSPVSSIGGMDTSQEFR